MLHDQYIKTNSKSQGNDCPGYLISIVVVIIIAIIIYLVLK